MTECEKIFLKSEGIDVDKLKHAEEVTKGFRETEAFKYFKRGFESNKNCKIGKVETLNKTLKNKNDRYRDENQELRSRYNSLLYSFNRMEDELNALKKNKIWHDLHRDPADLPKMYVEVLGIEEGTRKRYVVYYGDSQTFRSSETGNKIDVRAWKKNEPFNL